MMVMDHHNSEDGLKMEQKPTYIKELVIRGFKSFKHAKVVLPKGYIVIAGANGSGKSNFVDSLRFVLGETSIKSLRAKRVSDLVNWDAREAFVKMTCVLEGKKYEIKRYINKEGKSLYKLNGKKTTRTAVIDLLRKYGIELSPHNTIAQGEVQKIVEMNSKERRQIIDTVAGISEFESKKDEALRELEKVQRRINDAKIVLDTKESFLKELEKEKDDALQYMDASDRYKRGRATIVHHELVKTEEEYNKYVTEINEIKDRLAELDTKLKGVESQISALSEKKDNLTRSINELSTKNNLISQLENLRVKINVEMNERDNLKENITELEKEITKLENEKETAVKRRSKIKVEIKKLQDTINGLEKQLPNREIEEEIQLKKLRGEYDRVNDNIAKLKEEIGRLSGEVLGLEERITELSEDIDISKRKQLENECELLKKDIGELDKKINKLYEEEKKILKEIPKYDEKLLKLKSRAAELRPLASGRDITLSFIDSVKDKIPGIYGTVAELISFDDEYSEAIQMAGGARLRYVIVEDVDTAVKVINLAKKEKIGHLSFIPLDKIIANPISSDVRKIDGCLGTVLEYVRFDPKYYNAMAYVFGNTLLVDSVSTAKKLIGRYRSVTISGELFEASGVISGGSSRGSLAAKLQLKKVEDEIEEVTNSRNGLYRELEEIREVLSRYRRERAQIELKYKNVSVELEKLHDSLDESKKKELEKKLKEKKGILEEKTNQLNNLLSKRERLVKEISNLESKVESTRNKIDKDTKEILDKLGEFKGRLEGLNKEDELLLNELEKINNRLNDTVKSLKNKKTSLKEREKSIKDYQSKIEELEEKVKKKGKDLERLMEEVKLIDKELERYASEKGKLTHEINNLNNRLKNIEIKKASLETKLVDLKTEYEDMKDIKLLDIEDIDKLKEIVNESERIMKELGTVNLKAPEVYEEKKKEVDEIKEKIEQLDRERESILNMISEIETRKKMIFMETFYKINSRFKELYKEVFKDSDGYLQLTNPSDPFQGGIVIKVKRNNSYRNIESFSGGEKALLALLFIFSILMIKKSPLYMLDEADAPLDKENSKKLANLIRQFSKESQFIVVSHNDVIIKNADVAFGVSKTDKGSVIVGLVLNADEKDIKELSSDQDTVEEGTGEMTVAVKTVDVKNKRVVSDKEMKRRSHPINRGHAKKRKTGS